MEQMIFYNSIPSTNDEAKKLAAQGAKHGTAVLAVTQTAGRGRMGRTFLSPEGGLYLSVILRPKADAQALMPLTAVLAAAACDAVEEVCHIRPGVKWVNDLVLGGKKLAGILTELSLKPDGSVDYAVCGIGINCNAGTESFSPEVRQIATSVFAETGQKTRVRALAQAVCSRWVTACDTVDDPAHMEAYRKACVTLGKTVRIMGTEEYTAMAVNVEDDGALTVKTEDGILHRVFTGEVSVRGLYGYV